MPDMVLAEELLRNDGRRRRDIQLGGLGPKTFATGSSGVPGCISVQGQHEHRKNERLKKALRKCGRVSVFDRHVNPT
jgi:hypothetical protein